MAAVTGVPAALDPSAAVPASHGVAAAIRSGLPYWGLRSFSIDKRLLCYVPLAQARELEVLPLVLIGNRLKLACADPDTDVSAISVRLPRLAIDLVVTDRDELLAALAEASL